jgi:hypothetical protein
VLGHARRQRRVLAVLGAVGAAALWMLALNGCCAPLRVDPLTRKSGSPVVDGDLELARAYAPWVYHEIHPTGGRQDVPAPVDFDGNLDGDDNWESFPHVELVPTLSYAHVETRTHHFLTYHVFHPRDWEPIDLGVHMTHEGDGENLQVVVEKLSGRVVLLFTQAHYEGGAYARDGEFEGDPDYRRGALLLVDGNGRPSPDGKHAAVFIEAKGHGIFGALDDDSSRVAIDALGRARFERAGLVLRPARAGESVDEPALDAVEPVPYQLDSTRARLWPLLLSGEIAGDGRLLDGLVHYSDARVSIELPKFHEGDRYSGPLGSSRGISPFAVDFGWSAGTLGALFFDPARRYAQVLSVPSDWSLEYVAFPFATR